MLPLLLVSTVLLCLVGAQCPDGTHYDSSFQKCYQFVSTPTDFLAAEFNCRSIGGHLVTVGSGFENSLVGGMAFGRGNPWIGYNYLQKSLWSWTSGSNSTFSNFASGQPADPSVYQCASLRSTDNTWLKEMCSANRPYICDVSPIEATTTASPTASPGGALTCSTGYSMYSESNGKSMCYKVDYNFKTWQHAVDYCAQDGGVLPKIEDAGTNAFILALAEAYTFTNTEPWIGLICPSKKSSDCYWISDNSKLGNYQNWYSAQYPSGGSVNGTLMNTSAGAKDGTWGSANLFASSSCQKDPVPMSEFVEEVRQRRAAEKKENKSVVGNLICMGAVCFVFLNNMFTVGIASLCVLSICCGILGILSLTGTDLDPITMAAMIISVGFSVDIPAHVSYHYYQATIQEGPLSRPADRLANCLSSVAFPALQAALSTILCVCSLLFVNLYMAEVFVKTMVLCVVLCNLHGLVFLPAILIMLDNIRIACRPKGAAAQNRVRNNVNNVRQGSRGRNKNKVVAPAKSTITDRPEI